MRSYLGLVGYVSKFIPDYSTKTDCLRKLTLGLRPNDKITMNAESRKAFQSLKDSMSNAKTLAYFDVGAETQLYVDASPVGLGLVLTQTQKNEQRVICYGSRALTPVETRYCQTEKEALSIVWACERLHHYLFGVNFVLLTDYKALEVIYGNKKKKSSARIERWVLRLQSYDFTVKHVKGALNIADSLSRLTKEHCGVTSTGQTSVNSIEDVELYVRNLVVDAIVDLEAITAKEIERAADVDPELTLVREAIITQNYDNVPRVFRAIREELCVVGRLVMRGTRIIVPVALRKKMLELGHEGHMGIVGTKKNLRGRVWWPGIDSDVERLVRTCHGCQVTNVVDNRGSC
jgi:hypothetical protein